MTSRILEDLVGALENGELVPYLGPGALAGVRHRDTGAPLPGTGEELILAMNGGKPMAPRLMYEFPRAAMNLELKRGRAFVERFLTGLYQPPVWTPSPLHGWLVSLGLPYLIDINRDTQLQDAHAATPHTLIQGIARIGGTDYRFRLYAHDGVEYREIEPAAVDPDLPILFKPMGTPRPAPAYIASDADYVDYITELMGGFAVPDFVKRLRMGKQYLLLGLPLTRDTERMVLSDLIHGAGTPAGYALIAEPSAKERRFCQRLGIEIVEAELAELLAVAGVESGAMAETP